MPRVRLENLSYEALFEGVVKVIRNAQCLVDEAHTLHKHKMYARSYALSHFSREEFGKSFMLIRAAVEVSLNIVVDWIKLSKRFRDHKQKIVNDSVLSWILFANMEIDGKKIDLEGLLSTTENKNNRKNECLYVDWANKKKFVSPEEIVTKEKSERNLSLAEYRIALYSPLIIKIIKNFSSIAPSELKALYLKELQENP